MICKTAKTNDKIRRFGVVITVFVSRKIEQELNVKETKPAIVDQHCLVYGFQCDLCDAGYVGYTRGRLRNRVKGNKQQSLPLRNTIRTCTEQCLRTC